MRKVGLLGGSFDPIHLGHVEMAKQAKRQLHLDEVWFVVSNDTPLKERVLSDYQIRVNMVKLAIASYRNFKVCTIEKTNKGKNYTIDTVHKLKKLYKDSAFFFIVGGDQVEQLDKWKDIDKLQQEVSLCYFERDGKKYTSDYKLHPLHMNPYPISSSTIREGKLTYLNPKVKRYISENYIYAGIVSNYMSEYRYQHSMRVAELCVNLAKVHGYDEKIAYLAGMYHDINKEFTYLSLADAKVIIEHLQPNLLKTKESIWHGFLGSYVCKHHLGIYDHRILEAIEHHVLGSSNAIYAKILYIADKLDPDRDYDTQKLWNIALTDIHAGFKAVKEDQEKFYGEEFLDE
ncbi:nicotinate-nucleotide adenylyltransferase [Breznakia sp. PF5-3]|uniref:nicotinate (nicotinamide) nucleotide adenylyltransferase n=1 Tax=unclassified Breznakia TaxID=2623764 RepID=UPI002404BDF0|nr:MULTISPECIES: nicotinate (nicotinamide) nucleotide adenylyltransferase [unclassified Breznakia]MDF9824078.1 nicotinate-nucleotide adenylyltransferase [Breznakia sp. PM6-1]MDF9834856.1 nicotinate-nucleotide adenylyltransferase [Breznakia sp. PF5-3]MDF9837122.1 nicotinate-nucleotide adenylyltransferase [Breznakia sp. PFB2-8]MDF9859047.1 nicotinate-nucleotide adenylyltransferase [Breznakia sp. PH5-24]